MIKLGRRGWSVLAVAAVTATAVTAVPPAARANVQIAFPTQAMEGDLQVGPGTLVQAGYAFAMTGHHPGATVTFPDAQVTFDANCVSGSGGGVITVPLSSGSYADPGTDRGGWYPSADQSSVASYEGAATVPDLCGGGQISLAQGGTFTAMLESSDATNPVRVRWHYSAAGSPGTWSGTKTFTPGPGGPPPPPPPPQPTQIIVKVDLAGGYTIGDITAAFPVTVDDGGLASRGIYLVSPSKPLDPRSLRGLARQIDRYQGVLYAEVNLPVLLADTEFYAWAYGPPSPDGQLPAIFTHQPAATALRLAAAHRQSKGTGVTVAVLDTGADPVPALRGRLLKGWNYVADNANTRDVATRAGDAAVGHGTFVSGLVALVAPQARILPEKVLNSDGFGTAYGAAQAIMDATAAGANVINLSFGTETTPSSLLQEAVRQAQAAGVVIVASAGNEASRQRDYPAAWHQTISVAATDQTNSALTSFSNYGPWVDVAAPGEGIVGPMPGGSYDIWAGTSMSAPFVSGQAALLRSETPGLPVSQVFRDIERTAQRLPQHPVRDGAVDIVASLEK